MFHVNDPKSIKCGKDKHDNYFIDRDGHLFRYILNYLRTSTLHLPGSVQEMRALLQEAEYFGCEELKEDLKKALDKETGK